MGFEQAVLEQAIKGLFNDKHFSICALDDIGKIIGVNPALSPNYKYLRTLHCVNYSEMSPVILNELQVKVAECLKPLFNPSALTKALLMEGADHVNTEDKYLLN